MVCNLFLNKCNDEYDVLPVVVVCVSCYYIYIYIVVVSQSSVLIIVSVLLCFTVVNALVCLQKYTNI